MTRLGTIGELRILTVHSPERTFVSVAGPLDIATRDHLEESLTASLSLTQPPGVFEVDLEDVEFADSTGVMALLALREEARQRGIEFVLGSLNRQLRFVIDLLERLPADARPQRLQGSPSKTSLLEAEHGA